MNGTYIVHIPPVTASGFHRDVGHFGDIGTTVEKHFVGPGNIEYH